MDAPVPGGARAVRGCLRQCAPARAVTGDSPLRFLLANKRRSRVSHRRQKVVRPFVFVRQGHSNSIRIGLVINAAIHSSNHNPGYIHSKEEEQGSLMQ